MSRPSRKLSRRQRLVAFGPALVVVGVTAVTASGLSIVNSATASNVDVVGTVSAATVIDATPGGAGCPDPDGGGPLGETMDFGGSWAGTPTVIGTAGAFCEITFASTGGSGAQLRFQNALPGAEVFCNDPPGAAPRSCAAGNVNDVPGIGSTLNGGTDRFGLALATVSGGATADNAAGTGVSPADGTPLPGDSIWAPVPDNGSPAQMCATTGPNPDPGDEAVCGFAVGVNGEGAAVQPSGDYSGRINFSVAAL